MPDLRTLAKSLLARTPYRVVRAPRSPPRFQAIPETLRLLREMGYRPQLVLDAGANVGWFGRLAAATFPEATIHLIEPQPECQEDLRRLAASGRFEIHPFALGDEEDAARGEVLMTSVGGKSTGAYVSPDDRAPRIALPATSLDRLFHHRINADDRALLKMDLQGYEPKALAGAIHILPRIEVVLSEVTFFQAGYTGKFAEICRVLDEAGFDLFDVASLAGRWSDNRLTAGDCLFVRRDAPLYAA